MITAYDLALSLGKIPHDAPIKFSLNGKIYEGHATSVEPTQLIIFLEEEDDSFPAYQSHLFAGNSNESEEEDDSPKSNLLGGGISFPIGDD